MIFDFLFNEVRTKKEKEKEKEKIQAKRRK